MIDYLYPHFFSILLTNVLTPYHVTNPNSCSNKMKVTDCDKSDKSDELHIGQLIKNELDRQGRSVAWLAKQMQYSRQNVYRLLERHWIHTDVLLRICNIMDCDFFGWLSDYWKTRKKPSNPNVKIVKQNDTN